MSEQSKLVAVLHDAIPLDSIGKLAAQYPGCRISAGQGGYWVTTPGESCGCMDCEDQLARDYERITGDWFHRGFIVCPDCGNKRCPKATHHDNPCSGSNEPGQKGSVYK